MKSIEDIKDFGKITITLKSMMDQRKIKIYQRRQQTKLKFETVKGCYDNLPLSRYDTEILAKFCYVLDCNMNDILTYHPVDE